MKNFVVDLPSDLSHSTEVMTALKIYASKNREYGLLICGSSADLAVMEGNDNIVSDHLKGPGTSAGLALSHLGRDAIGLLSFSERGILLKEAQAAFAKQVSPCFALLYPGVNPDKETMLIDAGGYSEPTPENIEAFLSYAMDFLTNILHKPTHEIGVAYLALEGLLSREDAAIDSFLKEKCPNYRGIASPSQLFDSAFSVILAAGAVPQACLEAANAAKRLQAERQAAQSAKNFLSKWSSTDRPSPNVGFDTHGYYLFGFGHHIYSLGRDAAYNHVMEALSALERFDRNQPRPRKKNAHRGDAHFLS